MQHRFSKISPMLVAVLLLASTDIAIAQSRAKTVKVKSNSRTVGDILKNIRKTGSKQKTRLNVDSTGDITNEAKQRNLKAIKPPSQKKLLRVSNQEVSRLEQVVDKSIEQMFRLIRKYKKSARRGELWLRQGELYVEKARLVEQRLFNDFDRRIELYNQKKLKRKPKIDLSPALEYYKKAETLYNWFLRDFPKDSKADQALFFLGYINFELNKKEAGEHYYTLLTKKYPKSEYVTEAHFALGEFYFERDDWRNALTEYNKVAQKKNSRLYSFAYYKRAWCLYRIGLGNKAVKSLERVIITARQAKRDGVDSADSRIRLATEALRDIVLFYSESGDYKKAQRYFRLLAGTKPSLKMLENLAYLYSAKGKILEARYIFKSLIAKDPSDEQAYQYQKQIVLNYSNTGNRKMYKRELVAWVQEYDKNSAWYRKNRSNEKIIQDSERTREKLLRVHTLKWHQNYQNTKSEEAIKEALFGYDLYFEYFQASVFAHEMYFYSGELYFDLESFKKAGFQYQKAVETASDKSNKFLKKASLNRLISMEKNLPSTQKMEAKTSGSNQPIDMPTNVREFVLAGVDHVQRFPKDESTIEVKFRVARIFYLYNIFDKAEVYFKDVVREAPKSKYAEYSANLLLDIYNIKEDYTGMARVGNEILSVKGFQNAQLTNDIQDIVEKAAFNQGQGFEKKGQYSQAAKSFTQFAQKYPGSSLAISALYNAGVNYERAGMILQAIPIYERVKKNPKKQDLEISKKARLLQANLYEKTGDLEKAAFAYDSYADTYKKDPLRSNLYNNAAVIFSGAGKHTRAINAYSKFYELNKRNAKGTEALFKIAREYEDAGNRTQAIKFFNRFLNASKSSGETYAEAAYRLAELYERSRDPRKAKNWYNHIVSKVKGKDKVNYYKAASLLKLNLELYESFVAIRLPKNTKKQQQVVQQKINLLDRLNSEFTRIIKLDSGEQAISSLIWSGKAYEHMATSILTAPMPKGLNEEQKAMYRGQLKKITDPMIQTSEDNYKAAITKAFDLDLYSDDISIAFEKLAKKYPKQYPYWDFKAFPSENLDTWEER